MGRARIGVDISAGTRSPSSPGCPTMRLRYVEHCRLTSSATAFKTLTDLVSSHDVFFVQGSYQARSQWPCRGYSGQ